MNKLYKLLRHNKEIGPFTLDDLKEIGLTSSDLIWVEGESSKWKYPYEVEELGLGHLKVNYIKREESADERKLQDLINPNKNRRKSIAVIKPNVDGSSTPASQPDGQNTDSEWQKKDTPIAEENTSSQEAVFVPEIPKGESLFLENDASLPNQKTQSNISTPPPIPPIRKKGIMSVDDFEEPQKENEVKEKSEKGSNSGAFIFAGLLFIVAIAWFGYNHFKDKENSDYLASLSGDSTNTVQSDGAANGFNDGGISVKDDTTGTALRAADLKRRNDSIILAKKMELQQQAQQTIATAIDTQPVVKKVVTTTHKVVKDTAVKALSTSVSAASAKMVSASLYKPNPNSVVGAQVKVYNKSAVHMDNVKVKVAYYDAEDRFLIQEVLSAKNIPAGKIRPIFVPNISKAKSISFKVLSVDGKAL